MQPINAPTERTQRLAAALAAAPLDNLLSRYRRELAHRDFAVQSDAAANRLAEELDRRGIAPVFRVLRDDLDHCPYLIEHVALRDLIWLRQRHPAHKVAWLQHRGVFHPDDDKALKAMRHLLWEGRRPPAQLIKALALTLEQAAELAWIIPAPIAARRRKIAGQRDRVAEKIAGAVRGSRDRRSDAEKDATIRRRAAIWQAAELADWSPTRTAELFAMMPGGEPLPRNVIGNQLAAIKEALNYKTPRMGGAQGT